MHRGTKIMKNSLPPVQIHKIIQQLSGSEPITVTVQGECMMPLIQNNSRVQVTSARLYWPGDVVVVLSPGRQYLVHRVIGVYRRSGTFRILTQADNAVRPDTAVQPDALLGKVSAGSCHRHAVKVPISHRLAATIHFLHFLTSCLLRKSRLFC